MADLTKLTLKAAIDGLKGRDFSSEEITKAFVANIDAANPTLNAYVIQTTDKALDMARASDARLAKGEGGPRTPDLGGRATTEELGAAIAALI